VTASLLEVGNLGAFYGQTQVLHGLTFRLKEGGITTLLGANGAGKTTTLRAISGLVRTTGAILFQGERIDGRKTEDIARRGIAHVPDGRGTFQEFTVEENLRLGAYARRDRANIAADFEIVYAYFPKLKERRRQQAGTLSGGEQQMLAISRGLMMRPKLFLLDEPSFGLAPLVVQEIFAIMQAINRQQNVGMLLVEQNANLAFDLADRAYLLETGRVVLSGSCDELKQDSAVRRSYLGY
jgi:branched-chain amino acid transport system ATP-binding protein